MCWKVYLVSAEGCPVVAHSLAVKVRLTLCYGKGCTHVYAPNRGHVDDVILYLCWRFYLNGSWVDCGMGWGGKDNAGNDK